MVKLRATAQNVEHPEGTVYEKEPAFAAADKYQNRGILVDDQSEPLSNSTEEIEPSPAAKKGRYKRRDLRADE